MITELWIIRHGRPCDTFRGRCYGKLDVPLAPDCVPELKRIFTNLPALDAVYCSPRTRCIETAQLIAPGPIVLQDLSEIHFGEFEGRTYDEIAQSHPEIYAVWMTNPTAAQFPGGESFPVMQTRVLNCVSTLVRQHARQRIGIVAHGGVNRIVLADALNVPDRHLFRIGQKYGAVNLIRYDGDQPIVELMNGS